MRHALVRFLVNALALAAAVWLVPGLHYRGTPVGFLVVAAVFGLVNALLRPILVILTCPLIVVTLGLFTLVINAILLLATGALSRHWELGFAVDGFLPAFAGGLIIGLSGAVLALVLREPKAQGRRDD